MTSARLAHELVEVAVDPNIAARVAHELVEVVVLPIPNLRVTANYVEVLVAQEKAVRVTGEYVEVLTAQEKAVRVTGEYVEALVVQVKGSRVGWEYVEVILEQNRGARVSAEYLEVIVGPAPQDLTLTGLLSQETFGGNLVKWNDATFEFGTGNWEPWTAFLGTTTDQALHGQHALTVRRGSGNVSRIQLPQTARVVPGRTYTAMLKVRPDSTARTVRLKFSWFDATGVEIGASTPVEVVEQTAAWAHVVVTGVPPAGTVSAGLIMEVVFP